MNKSELNLKLLELELLRNQPNHYLHLALTFLTGVWAIAWLYITLKSRAENSRIDKTIEALRSAASAPQSSATADPSK